MKTIKNSIRKKTALAVMMVVLFFMSSFQEINARKLTARECATLAVYLHFQFFGTGIGERRNTTAVGSFEENGSTIVIIATNGVNIPQATQRGRIAQVGLGTIVGAAEARNGRYRIYLVTGIGVTTNITLGLAQVTRPTVFTVPYFARPAAGVHAEMAVAWAGINIGRNSPRLFTIGANRPYCAHCHLYLTRDNSRFRIVPNWYNPRSNPRNWQHPTTANNANSTSPVEQLHNAEITYDNLLCEFYHSLLPTPTPSEKMEESGDDELLTEADHHHLESENLEKESIDALETNAGQKLAVFPNPILDNAIIKCFDCIKGSNLSIYDVTGNLKREIKWNNDGGKSMPIDLSNFTKGIYFLKTENPNGVIRTSKLVKN